VLQLTSLSHNVVDNLLNTFILHEEATLKTTKRIVLVPKIFCSSKPRYTGEGHNISNRNEDMTNRQCRIIGPSSSDAREITITALTNTTKVTANLETLLPSS